MALVHAPPVPDNQPALVRMAACCALLPNTWSLSLVCLEHS